MPSLERAGRHLLGSKWTAVSPVDGQKHFVVLSVLHERGQAELLAVTRSVRRLVPVEELRDEARWVPGWR
ncbi:MAG: TIGR02450 family Trp-rich protein [Myxococcota bacterium]